MAQNQEAVIEENEHSPDFPRYRKRLNIEDEDQEVLSASSDGVQVNLTRSNASVGQEGFKPRHAWPAKEPMWHPCIDCGEPTKYSHAGHCVGVPMSESDDEEDKDLAWFFKKHHPDIDKHRQIAWCRTFANCLAAQMPKLRPKTYKKKAKTEPKEN